MCNSNFVKLSPSGHLKFVVRGFVLPITSIESICTVKVKEQIETITLNFI